MGVAFGGLCVDSVLCTYVTGHTHICACMSLDSHISVHVCHWTHTYLCVYVTGHTHICACMSLDTHISVHVCHWTHKYEKMF